MRQVRFVWLRSASLCALVGALGLPLTSAAQFKLIGPDGKITYTDRPAAQAPGKVLELDSGPVAPASASNLPLELRRIVDRYPVTLYALQSCDGCDAGRQFLRQRGIPHSEKLVANGDGELLQRLIGSRDVPALTIGSQVLRGFSPASWTSYLDAAGYPRQSRLPASYTPPPASPLAGAASAAQPVAPSAPAAQPSQQPPPATPGGIRF